MITCNLQGGIGNQMFQIAATYALALQNHDECGFDFNKCYTPLQGYPSLKYKNNVFKNIKDIDNFKPNSFYQETSHSYKPIPYSKNLQITGYFQSEKYFISKTNDIINLFYPNLLGVLDGLEINNVINKGNTTSIHIRRGDYLRFPNVHPTCSIEYYNKAINLILEHNPDTNFIVVADDRKWAEDNFKNKNNIYYVPDYTYTKNNNSVSTNINNDELVDLAIMALCNNNIIANSSFSWWGAYLNRNEKKIVIAPKNWFGPDGPKDTQDIIPNNWIKI